MKVSAIVPAAGIGSRMGTHKKKQFLTIKNIPIIIHTLKKLSDCDMIDEIIVVTGKEDKESLKALLKEYNLPKIADVTEGGATRQQSVNNGANKAKGEYLLIHDGVRPLITERELKETIVAAFSYDAAATGIPLSDTIKLSDENGFSLKTLSRENIVRIQTPQVIKKELYEKAWKYAEENKIETTDDISLAELLNVKPKITCGSIKNIKITRPEDIEIAEKLMD